MPKKAKIKKAAKAEKADATTIEAWFSEGKAAVEAAWPESQPSPYADGSPAHHWWTRGAAYTSRLLRAVGSEALARGASSSGAFPGTSGAFPASSSNQTEIVCPLCGGDLRAAIDGSSGERPTVILDCVGACKSGFTVPLAGIFIHKSEFEGDPSAPPEPPKPHRDPAKATEKLTANELKYISENSIAGCPACPDCKIGPLAEGPSGGGSINMICLNGNCGSQFNDTGGFGWDRLTRPQPLRN